MVDLLWCCVEAHWSSNFFLHFVCADRQFDMVKWRVCFVVAPNAGCSMGKLVTIFSCPLLSALWDSGCLPLCCTVVGHCIWCIAVRAAKKVCLNSNLQLQNGRLHFRCGQQVPIKAGCALRPFHALLTENFICFNNVLHFWPMPTFGMVDESVTDLGRQTVMSCSLQLISMPSSINMFLTMHPDIPHLPTSTNSTAIFALDSLCAPPIFEHLLAWLAPFCNFGMFVWANTALSAAKNIVTWKCMATLGTHTFPKKCETNFQNGIRRCHQWQHPSMSAGRHERTELHAGAGCFNPFFVQLSGAIVNKPLAS